MKITVDGQSLTQPLEILRDPKVSTSHADIERSVKLQLRIRDDVNKTADMVNSLEWSRKQLSDLEKMYGELKKNDVVKSIKEMDKRMQDVESKLVSRELAISDDKYYIASYKIYFDLLWLNGEIGPGAGDVAGGNDFGPTDTELALLDDLERDLGAVEPEYRALMEQQLPAFNRAMLEHGAVPVVPASESSGKATGDGNQ